MSWTADEVAQIRAAILALATGTRVVTVSYAGPPARSVTYGTANLAELRAILAEATASASATPSYRLVETRKGL